MDKQLKDKAIQIKGKDYVQVKDRVNFFNDTYPDGKIETKLIKSDGIFIVKAIVTPDCKNLDRNFTGLSQASFADNNSMVNKTSALENAETSAVGRALAFMGIGVIDSIASTDEINKATNQGAGTITREPAENAVDTGLISRCMLHNAEMIQKVSAKTGNPYWSHRMGTELCFGKEAK